MPGAQHRAYCRLTNRPHPRLSQASTHPRLESIRAAVRHIRQVGISDRAATTSTSVVMLRTSKADEISTGLALDQADTNLGTFLLDNGSNGAAFTGSTNCSYGSGALNCVYNRHASLLRKGADLAAIPGRTLIIVPMAVRWHVTILRRGLTPQTSPQASDPAEYTYSYKITG